MKKQTKKQILEILHFWPMSIVVPILLLLILFPGIVGAKEIKYLDKNYTEKQWEKIKWLEDTGDLKSRYETTGNISEKPYNMMWSTDIVRDGDYSVRLEYRDHDCGQDDCPRGDFEGQFGRTEINWDFARYRTEGWYRFSVFIPETTMHLEEGYTMFTQFKTHNKIERNGCPQIPLLFMLSDEGILVSQEPGDKDCTQDYDVLMESDFKGKWLDFLVHAKWSKKDNGFIHVWVNGEKKHTYEGMTLYNVDMQHLPIQRHNIYTGNKLEGHKQTQVMYFDAFYSAKTCDKMELESLGYSCNTLGN